MRSEVRLWRVSMPAPVLLVACGAHHTLAALATGGVVAWGRNNRGQVRPWLRTNAEAAQLESD